MATLTAWAFDTVDGAEQASQRLQALQSQELIKLQDAAVVSWEPGKKKPKTRQLSNMTAAGALGGTFWGMLFGLIFFVPLLGAAIGAGIGALAGSMTDVGISDDFINSVKQRVTPGTSALFVLSSDAVIDRIKDTFKDTNAELRALLAAFRYDVQHQGYATWEDLLAYGRNSAAAIGRLVLAVAGVKDPAVAKESDELCTALQLTNFWQDLSRDMPIGRITIPEGLWKSKTLDSSRLRSLQGTGSERWKALKEPERTRLSAALGICVERTETMFEHTRALPSHGGRSLARYLGAVWNGGHTVLDRVRALGDHAFIERPSLSWTDRAGIAWRAVVTRG